MMIIDAQIHVWAPDTPERPWARKQAHLPEPFGYEDLRQLMNANGVDRAVLVPPGWEGDRIDFVLEGTARHPDRFAAMGRIPVQDPASAALLPGWKSQPGMLGCRVSFQKQYNRAWLFDGTADWFWPLAEEHDIPLMMFAPGDHEVIAGIARRHPGLRIIIDHMGLNREKDDEAAAAMDRLLPLADLANLYVKVTSIPFYSTEPYPHPALHPPLKRMINAFGPQRCFWGTDISRLWSVTTYGQCVTLFTEELDFLAGRDLEWVMGRGLAECLRWPTT